MEVQYTKFDPTGNVTLIVRTPVPREKQPALAEKLMALDKGSEQVGFLEKPQHEGSALRLQMMGGEFCGNASISAAALKLSERKPAVGDKDIITLEISGADKPLGVGIGYCGDNTYSGSVAMPLPESNFDCELVFEGKRVVMPVVRMPGIAHAVVTNNLSPAFAEKAIAEWCRQLNAEALGIMFYEREKKLLNPLVYVASTGSTVWESSCASGSCAVCAYESARTGESTSLELRQPGGTLKVESFCKSGALFGLKLTGSAKLCESGSFEIDI